MSGSLVLIALIALAVIVLVCLSALVKIPKREAEPEFHARSLMNKSEQKIYRTIRSALPAGWSVMAQVSYGAFLGNRSVARRNTIQQKRADFVVLDPSDKVAVVVEYQGAGHFGKTAKSKERAKSSDRIKRDALREAGIELIEVPAKYKKADLIRRFSEIDGVAKDTGLEIAA